MKSDSLICSDLKKKFIPIYVIMLATNKCFIKQSVIIDTILFFSLFYFQNILMSLMFHNCSWMLYGCKECKTWTNKTTLTKHLLISVGTALPNCDKGLMFVKYKVACFAKGQLFLCGWSPISHCINIILYLYNERTLSIKAY